MKRPFLLVSSFLLAFAPLLGYGSRVDGFRVPPREHYPETWFHFLGGNISKEGIAADVAAIDEAGIRGIQFFDGLSRCGAFPGVTHRVRSLSPEWMECVGFLADECRRRDIAFTLQNCPGWSMSGGPWITPDKAMRELVVGKTLVDASTDKDVRTVRSPQATDRPERDYRDIAVIAFPSVAGEWDRAPVPQGVVTNADGFTLRFGTPVTARTLELPPVRDLERPWPYEPDMRFALLADGVPVVSGAYPQSCYADNLVLSVLLGERTAKDWKLVYRGGHDFTPMPFRLLPQARMQNYEAMSGRMLRGTMPRPDVVVPKNATVAASDVIDLTDRLRPDGTLDWTPPPGRWTVLRFGHVNKCRRNHPAVPEATGWECDKLDPRGAEAAFGGYVDMLRKGPLAGGKVQGVLIDSLECGAQTWTWKLPEEFLRRRGLDVRTVLPALIGYVLDDVDATERTLRSWRGFLGELIEENYYRRMAELAHERGLRIQYETAFGDVLPGDLLRFWKYADTPMCEFWQPHDEAAGGVGSSNYKPVRPCVSAAHIYGKRRVAAEAFTSFQLTFDEDFNLLKRAGDFHFARGVTHFVFHTYSHNPLTNAPLPGVSMGSKIGTPFLRGQPWWPFMKDFCTYVARCETQLERGFPVVDVLWLLGDAIDHKPNENADFPFGLKYDYCNQDVLLNRLTVRDGTLVLPDGMTYAALWVPKGICLDDKSAARVSELERQGARIFRDVASDALAVLPPQVVSAKNAFNWYHRRDGATDIYFVAVETNGFRGVASLRGCGGLRDVPLNLQAGESRFVIMAGERVEVLDPVTGEVELPKTEECLAAWQPLPGTNAFSTIFRRGGGSGDPVVLDLGEVHSWARVRVNGKWTRDLWCAPYRVDITHLLKPGDNAISVDVVSTAYNQLVKDAAKPLHLRKASTVDGPSATDPLHPAGLYGPVTVRGCADWEFSRDGKRWRAVKVPHDWGVEYGVSPKGSCPHQGDLPFVGKGFYRRGFDGFAPPPGGRTYLTLDGVQCRSVVKMNGKTVGGCPYGYASETIDVTDALMPTGNVLEVEAENMRRSSRWYPGSGIFRDVTVRVCPPDHVRPNTLFVRTLDATEDLAHVAVSFAWRGGVSNFTFAVAKPRLWSPESPALCDLELFGETFRYGIRTAVFDPQKGFFLNGRHRQMRGVCMHHDLGPLGAAFDRDAARRQLTLLKEMGCDAIRTAHNPPAAALLDLCDEMGVMVLDEAFDAWEVPKGDYGKFWKDWHVRDLTEMVRRDRSHPCVVMWSIGNELIEHADKTPERPIRIATELREIVRANDPTRPVTFGCWKYAPMTNGCQNTVDAFGANYLPFRYAEFSKRNPTVGLVGTETCSTASSRGEYFFPVVASPIANEADLRRRRGEGMTNMVRGAQMSGYDLWGPHGNDYPPDVEFRFQEENPQVYGEFVWTGFDYIGEPDPCADAGGRFSYFGIFDLAGFPKDRYWLYKSQWRPDVPTAHILPHWTWPGREGQVTPVHVYTSGDEAELFVNGVSQGRQRRGKHQYRFRWDRVVYEPGEVRVKTWRNGRAWAEDIVKTAGAPVRLEQSARRFGKLTFVTHALRDANGTLVPNADRAVDVDVPAGMRLVALANGDSSSREDFKASSMRTFHGLLLAIFSVP